MRHRRIAMSILISPQQVASLLELARDAAAVRRALRSWAVQFSLGGIAVCWIERSVMEQFPAAKCGLCDGLVSC